jgi:acetyl esterase/lipase
LARIQPHAERAPPPAPDDIAGWRAVQADIEERARMPCEIALKQTGAEVHERIYASMKGLIITPPNAGDAAPAIFLHGGAYTTFSAHSSLFASAPMALALERPLISLDYPLAPHARFHTIVPATAAAIAAICAETPIAVIGDSAGGGLALAATQHALQTHRAAPARLVLISPWADLSANVDTHRTHAHRDPILAYEPGLRVAAEAYAGAELAHPDASPINADFDPRFPPALILCGSEEILLSDALRLHQRLKSAGAELALHEGLFHSFVTLAPHAPESQAARALIRRFIGGAG